METHDFNQLVEDKGDLFRHWVIGKTGDPHLAEDMTQEAFTTVWRKQEQFKGNNLAGWAFVILRNTLQDYRRHYHRESLTDGGELWDAVSLDNDPEGLMDLKAMLKQMPEIDQEAFLLQAAGYSGDDLAKHWDVLRVTANHRIFRARKRVGRLALET